MKDSPIFIHSLFRAGSTYFFNVFRRSKYGYWCYQEPLHEIAFFCRENPADMQVYHGETISQLLRHPQIDGLYFRELIETWPAWKNDISEQIIYDAYFAGPNEDIGISYWQALAKAAKGRPVFQECRTTGRIGAIKSQMGGSHIYLWRNPWDQWWSYKVTPYFDVANQLIIRARHAPQPVQRLLANLDLPAYGHDDLAGAFAFYGENSLTSEQSYLIFYLLWCLALREGMAQADLMLNIDRLSDSADYQSEMLARLKDAGIDGINFSDCRIPQGLYLDKDQAFFDALERKVHEWLKDGECQQQDIDQIQALRQQYQPASWNAPLTDIDPADLTEQASRARELAKRFETALAERARRDAECLAETLRRMQQAEAESRAHVAEAKAQQAEAERRAQVAEAKAQQIEVQLESLRKDLHDAHQAIQALQSSWSWRVTAPLRWASRPLLERRHGCGMSPQRISMDRLIRWGMTQHRLVAGVHRVVDRFPGLRFAITARVAKAMSPEAVTARDPVTNRMAIISEQVNPDLSNLTPRARQIYADLKSALAKQQQETS